MDGLLRPLGTSERAEQEKRYLKSDLEFIGVTVPDLRRAVKEAVRGSSWPRIDTWATDEDFWVRRSALLALLPGIRAGQPDLERFERYAAPMLAEKEFFIRKATGWVLREISKRDPRWVADWTARHATVISGVTFREAVRRLPPDEGARLRALRLAAGS